MLLQPLKKILTQLYHKYRQLLWQINKCFFHSVTIMTKQGCFSLPLKNDDPISRRLYITLQYELSFTKSALTFLREINKCPPKGNGTVLDIGANNGVISIGMLFTEEFRSAIAIEPDPHNFSLLQNNIKLNGLQDRFRCLNYAANDSKSTLQFELSETNYGDHRIRTNNPIDTSKELFNESNRKVINVNSDKIDFLLQNIEGNFRNNIRIIWIDVQGFEGFVFKGAKQLLSSGIPVISEIWPYGIKRSGMSLDTFFNIVNNIWDSYCVRRENEFIQYPINLFNSFLDELGDEKNHKNVIFIK